MESEKKQITVQQLKEGSVVITLNGDKWKVVDMKKCNRAGAVGDAIDNDGQFYKMTLIGPKNKRVTPVWHHAQKVLVPV